MSLRYEGHFRDHVGLQNMDIKEEISLPKGMQLGSQGAGLGA